MGVSFPRVGMLKGRGEFRKIVPTQSMGTRKKKPVYIRSILKNWNGIPLMTNSRQPAYNCL